MRRRRERWKRSPRATAREKFFTPYAAGEVDVAAGTFTGQATVFDYPFMAWDPNSCCCIETVIHRGAFAKTLSENGARVKLLWQHDCDAPIGKPLRLAETETALEIVGKLTAGQKPDGLDPLELMRDGILEMSIGFDTVKADYDVDEMGKPMRRHLREVKLSEISLVTWGANDQATINEVYRQPAGGTLHDVDAELHEALSALMQMLTPERHVGKMLSAKNMQIVKDCMAALQALLVAAEPPAASSDAQRALTEMRHEALVRLTEIEQRIGRAA